MWHSTQLSWDENVDIGGYNPCLSSYILNYAVLPILVKNIQLSRTALTGK